MSCKFFRTRNNPPDNQKIELIFHTIQFIWLCNKLHKSCMAQEIEYDGMKPTNMDN